MGMTDLDPHLLSSLTLPFASTDFCDARLYDRAQISARVLARSWPDGTPPQRAERRGLLRWINNPRIDARRVLALSPDLHSLDAFSGEVLLIPEDTCLVRAGGRQTPRDAGPLRSARDRGYVMHAAIATDPSTGWPLAWLGADVWTRSGPLRCQDHKSRPPSRKESRKWARRRRKVVELLRDRMNSPRLLVHVTDREGDCWASLLAAWREGTALITRVAQHNRLIAEHRGGLRAYLRAQPVARSQTVTVRQTVRGVVVERDAELLVRYASVTLRPPRQARARARRELPLFAVWLHERSGSGATSPVDVMLLTTLAVTTASAAARVARWYASRWSAEIVFDLIKNACQLEAQVVTDVASFKRLVALAGPVAVKVSSWIQMARSSRPPPASSIWGEATLKTLRVVCKHYRVPTPPRWSARSVVVALGRLGGWEPRRDREPGWRVVHRGWQRLEEMRAFAEFLRNDVEESELPPPRKRSRKRGPP